MNPAAALEVADWRRRTAALYARVREQADPAAAHALWRDGRDGRTRLEQVGWVTLADPVGRRVALWRLDQYGGGLFLPLRDGTAGTTASPDGLMCCCRFHEAEAWKGPYPGQRRGAFRLTMFANIAHAARCYGRDDQRTLALYGYA